MTTISNTIEKLNAVLTVLNIDFHTHYIKNNGIDKAINEAINALTLLNKPPQVYIPHLNEFIEDKSFNIWEEEERFECSFAVAMTNWTPSYAESLLDDLVHVKAMQRADGSSKENDDLIAEAAELVLSKYEYISQSIVH